MYRLVPCPYVLRGYPEGIARRDNNYSLEMVFTALNGQMYIYRGMHEHLLSPFPNGVIVDVVEDQPGRIVPVVTDEYMIEPCQDPAERRWSLFPFLPDLEVGYDPALNFGLSQQLIEVHPNQLCQVTTEHSYFRTVAQHAQTNSAASLPCGIFSRHH